MKKQHKFTDTDRHRAEKLSTLLPEVQTGKFDCCKAEFEWEMNL